MDQTLTLLWFEDDEVPPATSGAKAVGKRSYGLPNSTVPCLGRAARSVDRAKEGSSDNLAHTCARGVSGWLSSKQTSHRSRRVKLRIRCVGQTPALRA